MIFHLFFCRFPTRCRTRSLELARVFPSLCLSVLSVFSLWLTAGVYSCFSVPLSCVSGYWGPEQKQTGLWGDAGSREDEEFSVLTYEVRIIHSDTVALALFCLFNSQFLSCCRLSQWNIRLLFSLCSNEIRMELTSSGSLVRLLIYIIHVFVFLYRWWISVRCYLNALTFSLFTCTGQRSNSLRLIELLQFYRYT